MLAFIFFIKDKVYFKLCVCAPECRYPWRPEEGVRSPGAGVIGSCE